MNGLKVKKEVHLGALKHAMSDTLFMNRCFTLAAKGLGTVAPNPLVGAVLVFRDKVIGEGYHMEYGKKHAEVNAIESVEDKSLIPQSTLYVNLEPCVHFGKTPPCTDLIIKSKINKVVISNRDPFEAVNGKGVEKLRSHGIEVVTDILKTEGEFLNRRFFKFHKLHQPYIILKWAQSADEFIGKNDQGQTLISNVTSRTLVHKWRTEEQAILVGTKTALLDNPQLNSRLWGSGKNPLRIVIDKNLVIPSSNYLFDDSQPTWILNSKSDKISGQQTFYKKMEFGNKFLPQLMDELYRSHIQSLIVEGGTQTLNSFIKTGFYDEIRRFTSPLHLGNGVKAPVLKDRSTEKTEISGDTLEYFYKSFAYGS